MCKFMHASSDTVGWSLPTGGSNNELSVLADGRQQQCTVVLSDGRYQQCTVVLADGRQQQRIVTVQKNFRGVKNFHLLLGAIRLLEYILFVKEQITRVSRWCVQKNVFSKIYLVFFYHDTDFREYRRYKQEFIEILVCYCLIQR